jgi:general stress protein 26
MGGAKRTDADIERKFWKAIRSDRTVMLEVIGSGEHSQPMTAQFDAADGKTDEHRGPIWFFTTKDTDLVRQLGDGQPAMMQFVEKGHGLFACVDGDLSPNNDRAAIERLWNPFVDAWFAGGKDDPNLQLLRFDPQHAQIWLNENSLFAGVRILLGRDPKKDYKDKMAEVRL